MPTFGDARRNASSRLDSMGFGNAGAPAEGEGKQPLGDVNYRAANDPQTKCGTCSHFDGTSTCDIVAGMIDAEAVCDLFEPAKAGPAGPGMNEGAGAPTDGGPPGVPA